MVANKSILGAALDRTSVSPYFFLFEFGDLPEHSPLECQASVVTVLLQSLLTVPDREQNGTAISLRWHCPIVAEKHSFR